MEERTHTSHMTPGSTTPASTRARPSKRIGARTIDLLLVVGFPVALGLRNLSSSEGSIEAANALGVLFFVGIWLLVGWPLYETLGVALFGRTLGKAVIGIRVTTVALKRPTFVQAAERSLLITLPCVVAGATVLGAGGVAYIVWMAVDLYRNEQGQTWPDRMARTLVIEDRADPAPHSAGLDPAQDDWLLGTNGERASPQRAIARIGLGTALLVAEGGLYYLFAATPWWPLGLVALGAFIGVFALAWGPTPSRRCATACAVVSGVLVGVAIATAGPPRDLMSARLEAALQQAAFERVPARSCFDCDRAVELRGTATLDEAVRIVRGSAQVAELEINESLTQRHRGIVTMELSGGGRLHLIVFVADEDWGGAGLADDEVVVFWDVEKGPGPLHA